MKARTQNGCPVCGEHTTSWWSKVWSSPFFPKMCSNCGAKVAVVGVLKWLHILWGVGGLYFMAFFAIYYWAWVPFLLFLLICIVTSWAVVRYSPLKEIPMKK